MIRFPMLSTRWFYRSALLLAVLNTLSEPSSAFEPVPLSAAAPIQQQPYLDEALRMPPDGTLFKQLSLSPPLAPYGGFVVNPAQREESRNFYNSVYQASENVPISWTGSLVTGNAGTTSQAFKDAVLLRVNYFRAMAGVPSSTTFSAENSAKAQQAALMMSANKTLSHTPPATWTFYTADGALAASKSNLALGLYGPDAITGYMSDHGTGNRAVGHRRWILYPQTQTMGTGDVPASETYLAANDLWVIDSSNWGARPVTREGFVAWPPAGYVPYQVVFPRWSFSYPGADFSAATVSIQRAGQSVPVTLEPIVNNIGESTLVWVTDNLDANVSKSFPQPQSDTTYAVTVANVKSNGITHNFSYDVKVFDPQTTGADHVEPSISGPATVLINSGTEYEFNPVPGAARYDWDFGTLQPMFQVLGAESGLAGVAAVVPSGYNPIAEDVHSSGAASYHLTNLDFKDQLLTLAGEFIPGNSARLDFKSRLGLATSSGQSALVEVSTDQGSTWRAVYQQAGSGNSGETTFQSRSIDLSTLAGKTVMVRFAYRYSMGEQAYPQTDSGVGWYIDDITLVAADRVSSTKLSPDLTNTVLSFTPSAVGDYFLRVRAKLWGGYPLEWGPLFRIRSVAGVNLDCTITGDGSGTVTSAPSGISCTTGRCSQLFLPGSDVTLLPTPGISSLFKGWGGDCKVTGDNCSLTLDLTRSVTAEFIHIPPVKAGVATLSYFTTLNQAYKAAIAPGSYTIRAQAVPFIEDLLLNRNVALILTGGYDAAFSTQGGETSIQGTVTIGNGSLTVEHLAIR